MDGMVNKAVEEMVCSHYGGDTWVEASRLKSDFLANMSHEIRTPLNSIIGVAEMLAATPLNDQQREFAHIIFESGNALLALISDILDFSKIEAGKLLIEQHPFELNRCIESRARSGLDQGTRKGSRTGLFDRRAGATPDRG